MKAKSPMTDEQIGIKIRSGRKFWVGSNAERKAALNAASFAGAEVSTRKCKDGIGFNVFFLNGK